VIKRTGPELDERQIADISGYLSEIIDAAAIGAASWEQVPAAIVEAFPGTMAAMLSLSGAEDRLNFSIARNIDPSFLESFMNYYAFRNPWASHWGMKENGTVMISEEDFPARLLAHTEFYNDWLKPQRNLEAAVGIKIHGDADTLVHLPIHYPLSMAARYDRPLARFLTGIRGSLARAQEISRHFAAGVEAAIAGSAVVDRFDCAAFVVDRQLRLRGANRQAELLFAAGDVVAAKLGVVSISLAGSEPLFAHTVSRLARRQPTDTRRIALNGTSGAWLMGLTTLPASSADRSRLLVQPQTLVLVLVRRVDANGASSINLAALADLFKLTRAELVFCQRLATGESLSTVAQSLGLSLETARSRCKTIFQKTGTHRQAELVALLKSVF
jgi:DNA-binding CsgD family transcriptional regulator